MDGIEIERKYDVGRQAALPTFDHLPGVSRVDPPAESLLEAVYFDTACRTLAAHGITLRRRTGGHDAGWTLKLPAGEGGRREVLEPPGKDPGDIPVNLLQLVRVQVRGRMLAPVARVKTRRIVHLLRGTADEVLAEVADDWVDAERLGTDPATLNWREWEIELVRGSRDLLDAAESMLEGLGVHPAAYSSKLARTLGEQPHLIAPMSWPRPRRKGPASAVFMAYAGEQVRALWEQDPRVRRDEPDAVHQMRVATRRLRSALGTYRRLLDRDVADSLRGELKWLAGCLGEARDAEVMRERLQVLLAGEPAELVMGPVAQRIQEQLGADYRAAHERVLTLLEDSRYFRLLDSLDDFLTGATVKDAAPARRTVAGLVRRDWKRLRRAVRATGKPGERPDHDAALHEVRKSAKRLRYAAESAGPVYGKHAPLLADAAHELQKILGQHQDSVVTRDVLRRLGIEAHLAGDTAFTYGRLHALEESIATESESRFFDAWKHVPVPPKP